MIDSKDWKKYREQVRLYNAMKWEDCKQYNEKLRKEHQERRERAFAEHRALETRTGRLAFFRYPTFVGYTIPIERRETLEDYLNWIADGRPTIAKKLKVKTH